MNAIQKRMADAGYVRSETPEAQAFRAAERARWEKSKRDREPCDPAMTWRPVLTEQEKQAQDEYIKLHNLPF